VILSLHPVIQGDENRIIAGRSPNAEEIELMKTAKAIILSQGVTEEVYRLAKASCVHVFPNYDARFDYPGKAGQATLFKKLDLPHPRTVVYNGISAFLKEGPKHVFPFPYVIKCSEGGEGRSVYLVKDRISLDRVVTLLREMEKSGSGGFVIQEFIENDHRDLRVVILGREFYTYWRCQPEKEQFLHNLSAGSVVDRHSDPALMAVGRETARSFSRLSGADLAALDLIFPLGGTSSLILEVNYFFGRQGLGGSFEYYELLQRAVNQWLNRIGVT